MYILYVHTCVFIRVCVCICTNKKLNASMYWRCHGLPEISFTLPPKRNGPSSRVQTCQLAGLLYEIQNLFWLWRLQGPINLDVFFYRWASTDPWHLKGTTCGISACMHVNLYVCAHMYIQIYKINMPIHEHIHAYVRKQICHDLTIYFDDKEVPTICSCWTSICLQQIWKLVWSCFAVLHH